MRLLSLEMLAGWQTLDALNRQAHTFRNRVLLRLHPNKLADVSAEERLVSEEAFKWISPKTAGGHHQIPGRYAQGGTGYLSRVVLHVTPIDRSQESKKVVESHEARSRAPGWWSWRFDH